MDKRRNARLPAPLDQLVFSQLQWPDLQPGVPIDENINNGGLHDEYCIWDGHSSTGSLLSERSFLEAVHEFDSLTDMESESSLAIGSPDKHKHFHDPSPPKPFFLIQDGKEPVYLSPRQQNLTYPTKDTRQSSCDSRDINAMIPPLWFDHNDHMTRPPRTLPRDGLNPKNSVPCPLMRPRRESISTYRASQPPKRLGFRSTDKVTPSKSRYTRAQAWNHLDSEDIDKSFHGSEDSTDLPNDLDTFPCSPELPYHILKSVPEPLAHCKPGCSLPRFPAASSGKLDERLCVSDNGRNKDKMQRRRRLVAELKSV
jgi:hypothetical protein